MSAKAALKARPNSFKFCDRVLDLEVPVKIGRAFKTEKSNPDNAYFDCKVLSKAHALLLYETEECRFFLLDTGSSNGTFVNNIRLSKSGTESELTEVFTGDILRFGSDVVDKSRNVTQKSVIMKVTLQLPGGSEHCSRPSNSRLYRPSDSYEDLSIVTTNLQTALSREKFLEDKLLMFKSILTKHSDDIDCSSLINDLKFALKDDNIGLTSKTQHDERKLEKIMKDNKDLVLKCKENDIKLKSKEAYCSNLQLKATEDANHITNLGNIIDKLRGDIANLEMVVNNVKNTQQKVRDEYEETLMNQRKMFDDEIEEMTLQQSEAIDKLKKRHSDEKSKLEQLLHQYKENSDNVGVSHCWSTCSPVPNTSSPFPLARSSSESTNISAISSASSVKTVLHALHKVVNYKGDLDQAPGETFDIAEDLEKSMDIFQGVLKAKDDEIEVLNTKVLELKKDLEFQDDKDKDFEVLQKIAEDEADTISGLEKENLKLVKALNEMESIMTKDKVKIKTVEEALDEERQSMLEEINRTVSDVDAQKTKYQEMQNLLSAARGDIIKLEEENARLKEQEEMNGKTSVEADYRNNVEQLVEQENKKTVEKENGARHVTTIKENKWKSFLGFMVLIAAVLYPFKMFYE